MVSDMATEKHLRLVDRLVERAASGALDWRESIVPDAYEVHFPNYTIRIWASPSISPHADPEALDYWIGIIDNQARMVDQFSDDELHALAVVKGMDKPYYQTMRSLHETARRTALGAEKALDAVLEELGEIPF